MRLFRGNNWFKNSLLALFSVTAGFVGPSRIPSKRKGGRKEVFFKQVKAGSISVDAARSLFKMYCIVMLVHFLFYNVVIDRYMNVKTTRKSQIVVVRQETTTWPDTTRIIKEAGITLFTLSSPKVFYSTKYKTKMWKQNKSWQWHITEWN